MKLITLAKAAGYKCYWCGKQWSIDNLSRDHIFPDGNPRRRGGGESKGGKVVCACLQCNADRGDMPFSAFKDKRRGLWIN